MPIYEYGCTKCGHVEEVMQKFSDRPLARCPQCSGKLRKLISQSTFHLKGSGWYVTDYANKNKKDNSSTDTKNTPKNDKKKEKAAGSKAD